MKKIQKTYENTIVITKSEFITHIYRVDSVLEAEIILDDIRKQYWDATHNCYAYIIGDNGEIQKCSDDGEPSKTAGAPMLDVLKKQGITNILAIVTRYFGGTLLGAGGLVRAYSQSVSECLKGVKFYVTKYQTKFMLITSYPGYNSLINNISYVNILENSFTNNVNVIATCDINKYDNLMNDLYSCKVDVISLNKIGDVPIEVLIDTSS
jgi:uncharacterized YigZ family protein